MNSKLKKSVEQQWVIRVRMKVPDDDCYDGIVLDLQKKYFVLQEEIAFEFDGIVVFAKKFVKGIRDNKFDACCNRVVRDNNQIDRVKLPAWLSKCNTISDILQSLYRKGVWPGIEVIYDEGKETAYFLGPITEVNDAGVHIKGYDAAGKWEKEYFIEYVEISRIEINTKYVKNFNKYMRKNFSN